ncbi:hypothetical protein J6590_097136 [Homalodisca vitripennis]|nr:hypothetical protein J6590_097136 [Homalodisca vitripennis]
MVGLGLPVLKTVAVHSPLFLEAAMTLLYAPRLEAALHGTRASSWAGRHPSTIKHSPPLLCSLSRIYRFTSRVLRSTGDNSLADTSVPAQNITASLLRGRASLYNDGRLASGDWRIDFDRRVLGRARPKTAELPHEGSPYRSTNHSRALSFSTEAALSRLLCCSVAVIRDKKRGRPRTRVISVPYTKVGEKGVPLRGQSRELVCRVRDYFQREKVNKGPIFTIGKNTVVRIGKEKIQSEQSGLKLNTPDKKYLRFKPVTELDAFQKDAIRRHVYGFFVRREYPTVRKLQVSLAEADLFRGSKSSVAIILKRLGFKLKKFGSRKILMERGDIIAWSC